METITGSVVKMVAMRFIRSLVAVILAGLAVKYGNNQIYLIIAPLLLALDKGLREIM